MIDHHLLAASSGSDTVDSHSLLEYLLNGQWDGARSVLLAVSINIAIVIVATLAVRWLLLWIVRRMIRNVIERAKSKAHITDTTALIVSPLADARVVQRTRTVGNLASNVISGVLFTIAGISILGYLGFNVAALVASAGVLGVALSFGAQTLVKDFLSGIFIVTEDQYGVGDTIDLGGTPSNVVGTVERVTLRVTQVRDAEGTLWYIRNGEILRVGNHTQGWSKAIVNVSVPFRSDVDGIETMLKTAGAGLRDEKHWKQRIIGSVDVLPLEKMDGDSITFVVSAKTRSGTEAEVARELRRRIHKLMMMYSLHLSGSNAVDVRIVTPDTRDTATDADAPQ